MKDLQNILKNIDLFSSLDDKEIELLSSFSKVEHYAKNSIVFYENDTLSHIYYLINGKVKLYKIDKFNNEIFLNELKHDSFIYLVKNSNKNRVACNTFYSVETVEESDVLLVDIEKFKRTFVSKYEILDKILDETYKMIEQFQYIINRDLVYDSTAKVVHMICNQLDEFNRLKKNDIAYHLHIQPETLSRIVKKLEKQGYIQIDNRNVTILNRQALEKFYK